MIYIWAGAWGFPVFNPIHYEDDFAKDNMLEGPIVHGGLKRAWLVQLMKDWIGEEGMLKKVSCQYRGVDYPRKMKSLTEPHDGETWQCKGKVTADGLNYDS